MKWKKFTIDTRTEAVDLVSEALSELGIQGIEIEDNVPLTEKETKGMFIDILPELPPDDGSAKVSFYLSADDETKNHAFQSGDAPHTVDEPEMSEEELLAAVREKLEEVAFFIDAGSLEITRSETEDKDWMNSWKQYFKPFALDRVLIRPEWEEIPEEHKDKIDIVINPGSAFGTGTHETTQLCIRQLEKYVKPGMEVLDVGCGSGILGITALKLGADHAFGTDLDEEAVTGSRENAKLNGLSDSDFHVIQGNIIDDKDTQDQAGYDKYDLVVANILAPVIVMLTGEVASHMKMGAPFITSGIVAEREPEVVAAFESSPDFEIKEITRQGEWVSVTAIRK